MGVRELSAGFVFVSMGFEPATGVSIAAVIGFLSLLSIFIHSVIVSFTKKSKTLRDEIPKSKGTKKEFHFEMALTFFGTVAIAILIGIQMRLPTDSGQITMNLADPLVFILALSFLAFWYSNFRGHSVWRIQGFGPALVLFVILILYGWGLGYSQLGTVDWALYNRTVGLLIILSYLFTGVMIAVIFGRKMIGQMVVIFTLATLSILIIYAVACNILDQEVLKDFNWVRSQYSGMLTNRNALAFALTSCLSIAVALDEKTLPRRELVIGLLYGLIFLTVSRSGVLIGGIILLLGLGFKVLDFKALVKVILWAVLLITLTICLRDLLMPMTINMENGASSFKKTMNNYHNIRLDVIQSDRLESYKLGFEMWLANPFFGAGLGAFISSYMAVFGKHLTIHNTGLWVLAEMGLFGFILFLALPGVILMHIWRSWNAKLEWDDLALLLLMISIVLFSQAHDMLYQRVFWLFLGILVANKLPLHLKHLTQIKA